MRLGWLARLHRLAGGAPVDRADLVGLSVLVLEDEPLVALDIVEALKGAGASVFTPIVCAMHLPSLTIPISRPRS